nr:hypothetical protein [Escherichia coli]
MKLTSRFLKHSIIDKDKKTCCTLFVLQEPVCCVVINTSFRITILQVVEIIKHLSMCILILQHEKRKKSPGSKLFEIFVQAGKTSIKRFTW